jgi:hypothetical protein
MSPAQMMQFQQQQQVGQMPPNQTSLGPYINYRPQPFQQQPQTSPLPPPQQPSMIGYMPGTGGPGAMPPQPSIGAPPPGMMPQQGGQIPDWMDKSQANQRQMDHMRESGMNTEQINAAMNPQGIGGKGGSSQPTPQMPPMAPEMTAPQMPPMAPEMTAPQMPQMSAPQMPQMKQPGQPQLTPQQLKGLPRNPAQIAPAPTARPAINPAQQQQIQRMMQQFRPGQR